MSRSAPGPLGPAAGFARAPLFVIAGSHGSLHWVLGTFYVLLPFIQGELGLSYTEAGALASVVHVASFAANLPSGALVDLSGRRFACQLTSLVLAGVAIGCLAVAGDFWVIAALAAILAVVNTLWHPAAISFLSSRYEQDRGMALSYHTVGASIGDALAPVGIGALVVVLGWQSAAIAGAGPPLIAALVLALFFLRGEADADPGHLRSRSSGGVRGYVRGIAQVVRDVRMWLVCALAGLRGTTQAGLRAFLPLFVVNELHAGAVWVGVVVLAFQGAGALATPFAGSFSDRLGRRPVLVVGLLVGTLATVALPLGGTPAWSVVIAAVAGASIFSLRPVIQGWALDITPPELGGSAISILFGSQALFAMTVPLLGGMVADAWGLAAAFYLFAAAVFCAAVLAGGASALDREAATLPASTGD